jgi:hypothetical protein
VARFGPKIRLCYGPYLWLVSYGRYLMARQAGGAEGKIHSSLTHEADSTA